MIKSHQLLPVFFEYNNGDVYTILNKDVKKRILSITGKMKRKSYDKSSKVLGS
jgi:hypothetical protein